MKTLNEKIANRSAHVSVIGLGYVGLPLAVAFAVAGYRVTGIDTNIDRTVEINDGQSPIQDVNSDELRQVVESGRLIATANFDVLQDADTVSICVPTPLRKTKDLPSVLYK
jgi:UDP-N-acetyl-D-glucosamine dehydrogenase